MQRIHTIRQHSAPVTGVAFDAQDSQMATCGVDGCAYLWSTVTWHRVGEKISRNTEYSCCSFSPSGSLICAAVENNKTFLRPFRKVEYDNSSGLAMRESQADLMLPQGTRICSLIHAGDDGASTTLIASTSQGTVMVFPYPLEDSVFDEHGLHVGACGHIALSCDGRSLMSVGGDGGVFVLNLKGLARAEGEGDDGGRAADVVLINSSTITEQKRYISKMEQENRLLSQELESRVERIQAEHDAEMKAKRERDRREIADLTRKLEAANNTVSQKDREGLRVIKSLEASHVAAADQLEALYEKKIAFEAERYTALQSEINEVHKEREKIEDRARVEFDKEKLRIQAEVERQRHALQVEIDKLQQRLEFAQHHYQAILFMTEQDHNEEVSLIHRSNVEEVAKHKSTVHQLKKEADALCRGLDLMEKDKDQISKAQVDSHRKIEKLEFEVQALKKTVEGLHVERKEREATLVEKEKKIGEYKVKVSTLKKFKNVLDHRLREVSDSLQPKDRQITRLKAQLVELEGEFEKTLADQRTLQANVEVKQQNIERLQGEVSKLADTVRARDRVAEQFRNDLMRVVENPDLREWPGTIKVMYRRYVLEDKVAGKGDKGDQHERTLEELDRQMRLMEKKIRSLAVKGGRRELACKQDLQKKAKENSELIWELNELRAEKKSMSSALKNLELRLKHYENGGDHQEQQVAEVGATRPAAAQRSASTPVLQPQLRKGPAAKLGKMAPADKEKMTKLLMRVEQDALQMETQRMEIEKLRVQALAKQTSARSPEGGSPGGSTALPSLTDSSRVATLGRSA